MKGSDSLTDFASAYDSGFEPEHSSVKNKFMKKYPDIFSAVEKFGENQNEFNKKASDCIEELIKRINRLEDALEAEIQARKKAESSVLSVKKELDTVRLRSTLNTNQLEKLDSALVKYSERTEDYILRISPGARLKDCPKGCREANIDMKINMPERIENIKKSLGEEQENKLHDLEKLCLKAVSRELSYFNAYEEVGIDFYGKEKYAEIIYKNLCKNSIYKINSGEATGHTGRYFVFCGDTANIPEKAILKSGMIFITGHKPLEGLSEAYINDLKFLNDCGIHNYTAMNPDAYDILREAGFRCVTILSAEELASGNVIAAVENGIENAIPNGAERFSVLMDKFFNSGKGFISSKEGIIDFIMQNKFKSGEPEIKCINSLEKTASAAILKNYFSTSDITSTNIYQDSENKYDIITGFDYISHFDYNKRKELYYKAKNMLKKDGLLLFSGKNPVIGIKMRAINGWEKYPVYEAMWTSEQLISELEENGFKIKFLIPTGTGLYDQLPSKYKNLPSLYIIGAAINKG